MYSETPSREMWWAMQYDDGDKFAQVLAIDAVGVHPEDLAEPVLEPVIIEVYRGMSLYAEDDPLNVEKDGGGVGASWTTSLDVAMAIAERGMAGFENYNVPGDIYENFYRAPSNLGNGRWDEVKGYDKSQWTPVVLRAEVTITPVPGQTDPAFYYPFGSNYASEQEVDIPRGSEVRITGYQRATRRDRGSDYFQWQWPSSWTSANVVRTAAERWGMNHGGKRQLYLHGSPADFSVGTVLYPSARSDAAKSPLGPNYYKGEVEGYNHFVWMSNDPNNPHVPGQMYLVEPLGPVWSNPKDGYEGMYYTTEARVVAGPFPLWPENQPELASLLEQLDATLDEPNATSALPSEAMEHWGMKRSAARTLYIHASPAALPLGTVLEPAASGGLASPVTQYDTTWNSGRDQSVWAVGSIRAARHYLWNERTGKTPHLYLVEPLGAVYADDVPLGPFYSMPRARVVEGPFTLAELEAYSSAGVSIGGDAPPIARSAVGKKGVRTEAGSSWRPYAATTFWDDFPVLVYTDGGPSGRKTYDIYIEGRNVATRPTLTDAKNYVEDRIGPQDWNTVRLDKVTIDHYYWGLTDEFSSPTTVYVVKEPTGGMESFQ
jgi:hypothetical protein